MSQAPWADSTFWLYTILVDRQKFGLDSRMLLRKLERSNIQTRPLWQPTHRSKAFERLAREFLVTVPARRIRRQLLGGVAANPEPDLLKRAGHR